MLTTRESISVAELVIYVPAIVVAFFVAYRQGFSRQLGFLYLVIFTIIKIAGAVVEILSQRNLTNTEYAEWAGILGSVGLSPLLLATAGLLKRVNDLAEPRSIRVRILQFTHLPCILGLVLAIYGGTKLTSDESTAIKFLKAAALLFLLTLLILIGIAGATYPYLRLMAIGETRIFFAVLLALPLLTVRTVYTILADFGDSTFGVLDGNAYVQLGMAIIEEMIVTIIYLVAGVLAPRMGQQSRKQAQGKMANGKPSMQVHDTLPPNYV